MRIGSEAEGRFIEWCIAQMIGCVEIQQLFYAIPMAIKPDQHDPIFCLPITDRQLLELLRIYAAPWGVERITEMSDEQKRVIYNKGIELGDEVSFADDNASMFAIIPPQPPREWERQYYICRCGTHILTTQRTSITIGIDSKTTARQAQTDAKSQPIKLASV